MVLDRDHNAARNILEKALSSIRGCTEGHLETDGLARETLLDREPLLSVPQGQMASFLDEGRTPLDFFRGVSVSYMLICLQDIFP